jgi:hypothetical protein
VASISKSTSHCSFTGTAADDRCCSYQELPRYAGISAPTVLHILHNKIGIRRTAASWLLCSLPEIQMQEHVATAHVHLEQYANNADILLDRIVSLAEVKMKHQSTKCSSWYMIIRNITVCHNIPHRQIVNVKYRTDLLEH